MQLLHTTASCRFCGAVDALPPDELGRVLDVKNRLTTARQRALDVRGFDAALARIFEDKGAFVRAAGLYAVVSLILLGFALSGLVTDVLPLAERNVGPEVIAQLAAAHATAPALAGGVTISIVLALAVGRRHYRARLRPLLVPRPPTAVGLPFRCRACGGDLPPVRTADVSCPYCTATNLLPKELAGHMASVLFREAEAARAQVHGASTTTMGIGLRMRRVAIVGVALSVILALSLPSLIRTVVLAM
jgi:hypothetical protein